MPFDQHDFEDEIRAHLEIAKAERVAGGADSRDAHLQAHKEFGNITLTREAARREWTPRWIDAIHDQISDGRYAIRSLVKNPAFALTVVGVLTLGIGANALVFTLLKAIAFSPMAGVSRSASLVSVFRETTA